MDRVLDRAEQSPECENSRDGEPLDRGNRSRHRGRMLLDRRDRDNRPELPREARLPTGFSSLEEVMRWLIVVSVLSLVPSASAAAQAFDPAIPLGRGRGGSADRWAAPAVRADSGPAREPRSFSLNDPAAGIVFPLSGRARPASLSPPKGAPPCARVSRSCCFRSSTPLPPASTPRPIPVRQPRRTPSARSSAWT